MRIIIIISLLFMLACDSNQKPPALYFDIITNQSLKIKTIQVNQSFFDNLKDNRSVDERMNDFIKDKNVLKILSENEGNMFHSYIIFYTEGGK